MPFEVFRERWLADVLEGDPSERERGQRLGRKLLANWLEVEISPDAIIYCDSSKEGGVDIAYLAQDDVAQAEEAPHGTWFIVQSHYGSALQGSDALLEAGTKLIEVLEGARPTLPSLGKDLLERLTTFRKQASQGDRVLLLLATERRLGPEQSQAFKTVRAMGRSRLNPLFDAGTLSIEGIYWDLLSEAEG